MNPMLKYRGGKSREIPKFEKYIPQDYERYIEPFFGGGALYFYLEPKSAIINDVNEKLITFYKTVKNEYQELRVELDEIQSIYEKNQADYKKLKEKSPDEHVENRNEVLYYQIRDMYNNKIDSKYSDAALYYFINKTAYSGMIRHNQSGHYNVPFGRYPNLNTKHVTEGHSNLLKNTDIYNTDYADIFAKAKKNDFIFLDPPYDCVFNDYGNIDMMNGFDEDQHRRLADDFKKLKCKALMIIGKTPLTEELYEDYIKDEYYKNYSVNIKNRFQAEAKHIVVTNYDI